MSILQLCCLFSLTFAFLGPAAGSHNCRYPAGGCQKNLIFCCHLRMLRNLMFRIYPQSQAMIFLCSITPTNYGQLSKPGTVLESDRPEDSKTVPES